MTVLLEFASADGALQAVRTLTAVGYLDIETHAPFPLTADDAHARRGAVPIAAAAFVAGVVAMAAAYFIQWYANVWSYPIDIGGRPVHAGPAFVLPTPDAAVISAAPPQNRGRLLGRRQVVRHRFLVPAFAGSNPAAPAKQRFGRA